MTTVTNETDPELAQLAEEGVQMELETLDVKSMVEGLRLTIEHADEIIATSRAARDAINAEAAAERARITADAAERRRELNDTIATALEQRDLAQKLVNAAEKKTRTKKAK